MARHPMQAINDLPKLRPSLRDEERPLQLSSISNNDKHQQ